ncbi:hypothetical protein ACJMK2_019531 [Sinanodonta woodiana]|uniref:Neurotransmitter-gated ion-channel ligand-binding domain-containing protein n=1 Tax=Sinanodonta woodiana TaxID=1069815 RepID=A0ABD3TYC0_SINWO
MWIQWIVVYCIILTVYGQTISDYKTLIRQLSNNYDNSVRPVVDQSQPVSLSIALDLLAIQEFDEVLEKFSVAAVIYIRWRDPSMKWESSTYNNLHTIMIPKSKVWTPTIIVKNSFDTVKPIGDDWMKIRYYKNGDAVYIAGNVFKTTCAVDVTFYPYDAQTCNITLISWPEIANEITISAYEDNILNSHFSENGEWEVTSTSVTTGTIEKLSTIDFTIKLKRRPIFILVNFLLPVFFIGILNIMSSI